MGYLYPDEKVLWSFVNHHHNITLRHFANTTYTEKVHPTGEKTFSLHITNFSKTDVGKYMCTVYSKSLNRTLEDIIGLKLYESGK